MRYIKTYNEGILDIFKKKKEQEMEVYKDPKNINDLVTTFLTDNNYNLYENDRYGDYDKKSPLFTINSNYTVDLEGGIKITNTQMGTREIKSLSDKVAKKSFSFYKKEYGKIELPISFNKVGGNFNVDSLHLVDMRLFPKHVGGNLEASSTYITSLKGCPEYVGGDFKIKTRGHLWDSPDLLRSLEYCPKYIGGNLDVYGMGIYTFEYFPEKLVGDFLCRANPIHEIWVLMNMDKNNIELFNDFDPIRESATPYGKPILYLDIMESFLNTLDVTYSDSTLFNNKQLYNGVKFYEKLSFNYEVLDSSDNKLSTRDVRQFCDRVMKDHDSEGWTEDFDY
jgi:hypothetical protein